MKIFKFAMIFAVLAAVACGGAAKRNSADTGEKDDSAFSSYRAYDHFVQGDLFEQAGDYASAANEYRKALIFDPTSAEIRRALSEAYFRQRKFTEAAVVRSEIIERNTDDYNFIGDCLRYSSDYTGAIDFYQRSLKLDPTQVVTRSYLAALLFHNGDYEEAEKQYKAVVEYSSEKVDAYLDLASFYLRISDKDKAMKAYRDAHEADPDDLRPSIGMASIYIADGDSVSADSIYSELIDKHWDNVDALNSLMPAFFSGERIDIATRASKRVAELLPDDADAQKRYAFLVFGNGKYAEAESLFTILEDNGWADAPVYYYHGRIKQNDGDFAGAEDFYNRTLALDDTLADAWINLALVVDSGGEYQRSLDVMKKAIDSIPWDSSSIIFYTSIIHARNDKYDLARDGYLRLLASNPDNIDFRFNLGAAYERLGEFEDSEKEFKWILQKEPDHALALNYLGYMYADKGINLNKALKMIEKAVSIDPENGAFLDSYAWVLYKLGRYDEALVEMKKALELDTSDPILFDHQGDIFAALNEHGQAKDSWQKALELDPENQEIQAKLNK